MNNAIKVFSNTEFTVRTTRDDDGTVWFVARDIAEALEYSEASVNQVNNLFSSVPEIWSAHKRIMVRSENSVEQTREMLCLTEQGVYFFLGRSDKPKALPYQMWIAGDVVPSIREIGSYSTGKVANMPMSPSLEDARCLYAMYGLDSNQIILALDKIYKKHNGFSALEVAGIQLVAPQQEQLLTPTEIGKQLGLSARRINEILAGAGFQHKIADKWEALGEGMNYAVMMDTGNQHSDGVPVRQLKWTSNIVPVVKNLLEVPA